MLVKRIALIVGSMVLGALLTAAIVIFLLETTIAEYGAIYFVLTSFFFGCAVALIADKFAGTELLPR